MITRPPIDIEFFTPGQAFDADFFTPGHEFEADFGSITIVEPGAKETYAGPYVVDPDFIGQLLTTADKVMEDDVTVNPIKVEYVSNMSGGKTVFIGGTING